MVVLPDFTGCHVIVIGDVILDRYLYGRVERISPEAPVPVVHSSRSTDNLGGAGNVAMNLKGLDCRHLLLGVRADDASGGVLGGLLAKNDIRHRLFTVDDRPTTTKTRIVGQRQQLLRLDEEDIRPLSSAVQTQVLRTLQRHIQHADAVILSDYGKGFLLNTMAEQLIDCCRRHDRPVFIDPKGTCWERYRGAFCITPNAAEFQAIAAVLGKTALPLAEAAEFIIRRYGFGTLLNTRGPEGMSLFRHGRPPVHIRTQAREVFDVSGAGDTVVAAFTAAAACGLELAQAAEVANQAAGIVVAKAGTQPVLASELQRCLSDRHGYGGAKVLDVTQTGLLVQQWRQQGERIVFTNGCFDILHIGHIKLLHAAAACGERLVVGLNSDRSVQQLKGPKRPVVAQKERAALLSSIEGVDAVVLFDQATPLDLIQTFKPDVIVKGGDYTPETVVGSELLPQWGGRVVIVPLIEGVSSTAVIEAVSK